ncbi:glycosyl transferase [Paraburkholderia ginsengiterrae]|uniref:Glycosyl transferase n=1 Tax=Paraburkholderia ginsengiterrae TaxID=1462993 RepID=A0A1A9NDL4_9BURK|nr:glycosyltransferase [Paraburkholderia ginsengiterrae]OAJ51513.1 glycosyl transferase [Paraburkholderia ginsengiterrae]OAJ64607.1 glycosyl transferase [Paraburkholderia ginsengiterrae]
MRESGAGREAPRLRTEAADLSISVVVYKPDVAQLDRTLATLRESWVALLRTAPRLSASIFLVDNGGAPDMTATVRAFADLDIPCTVIAGHGNVGYGAGHNLALAQTNSTYHLVLNPDVELAADALEKALAFLDANTGYGLLTPYICDERGEQQFLCRRFPTVLDLLARGFFPAKLRALFAGRLSRYEMREVVNDQDMVINPPIVSGCFMLFRTDVLRRLDGFDDRYFLYFEDYDLSLRTHDVSDVVYLPAVRILHHGGGASRKGWLHVRLFVASMVRFFNRFGWKWL